LWEAGEDCVMRIFIIVYFTKYFQSDQIKRVKWLVHVACIGEIRNAYFVLVRKAEEKRPLRRTGHRWEDSIRMDLRERF
jgi:hypothetical protein